MPKQVFLDYRKGEVKLIEVPAPKVRPNGVVVRTLFSVISLGTETLMISLAKKSLIGKALERPDLVKQALDFAKNEGLLNAYRLAMAKLSEPTPLGYSSAGIVEEVGENARGEFKKGDIVACAGHGHACHAELTYVPKTLCVKVPEGVKPKYAAFANVGSIALHSVRLAKPEIGSTIAVIGLGLLGLLAVQIARVAGCRVFGLDIVPQKVKLALKLGAEAGAIVGKEDVELKARNFAPKGFDAVIVFASTKSSQPVELAAKITREKGRVVIPGWVKLDLPRNLFYEKELELVVPRSSGPGLYDLQYESGKIDYPYAYVRWTVKRNMKVFLNLVKRGDINLEPLITHIFDFEKAEEVYKQLYERKLKGAIGILFKYNVELKEPKPLIIKVTPIAKKKNEKEEKKEKVIIGLIGAGQHAQSVLLPILKRIKDVELKTVCTSRPLTATRVAQKWGFKYATTDYKKVIDDPEIDAVFIATRHDTHAYLAAEALEAGKYVFLEKPLAVNYEQLEVIKKAWTKNPGKLMVGFNRRYAPLIQEVKKLLVNRSEPAFILMRINAGYTPLDHWIFDPTQGGGRIIGELCHFVDLSIYLTNSLPLMVNANNISGSKKYHYTDNVSIIMKHKDGSLTTITYTAAGTRKYSRERIEVFCEETVYVIDNFKYLEIKGKLRNKKVTLLNADRGHKNECKEFIRYVKTGGQIPYFEQYVYATVVTFEVNNMLSQGNYVKIFI